MGIMSIKEVLELSRELRLMGKTLTDATNTINGALRAIKPIKCMVGGSGSNNFSSKLITAGMACIAFPEPIISDIAGSALIAAGIVAKSVSKPTFTDIFREIRKAASNLKEASLYL